jgi:L-alanine-DL-glutamate epimerase-like enolase superfamily enzyme
MARIEAVELLSFEVPWRQRRWDCDGLHECTLVRITDEDGQSGLGEIGGPAAAADAFLTTTETKDWRSTLAGLLIGQDPLEARALWDRMFAAIQTLGRRGLGVSVISGLDIALYDLAGKQRGVPVYKLLGGAAQGAAQPYATIWPGLPHGRAIGELMADMEAKTATALQLGYRAVKVEVMFEDLVDDAALAGLIRQARGWIGDGTALAIDFGYRWRHWRDAAWLLDRVADCNLLFAEATLQHEDLDGHAKLAARSAVPICGAELAATRWEIREWIERGGVDIVQPCITRAGGFSEMLRIAELCALNGVQFVPHGWTGGLGAACAVHLQAACAGMPWIEQVPPSAYDAPLLAGLVGPAAELRQGLIALPTEPGLGVGLSEAHARQYRVELPRRFSDDGEKQAAVS